MIKACTVFHRYPGLTDTQYQHYWRTEHAQLVRKMKHVRRYVQNHPLLSEFVGGPTVYDGLVELWADDTNALRELGASPEYKIVVDDEYKLGDRSTQKLILTQEEVILDGKPVTDAVKQLRFLKRAEGTSPEAFQQHWREGHAALVGKIPGLQRYVQSHTKLSGYRPDREPEWDGISAMWFANLAAVEVALASPEYARVAKDLQQFTDVGRTGTLNVCENVVVG